ncbi:MAG: metallophosphoesterase [Pseudomonadota bacterium]
MSAGGVDSGGLGAGHGFGVAGRAPNARRYTPQPAGWSGGRLRIAALSDLHAARPWMTVERVAGIVAAANALEPDLIVLLGDYLATQRLQGRLYAMQDIAPTLSGLRAPMGAWAVLGNHDWRFTERERKAGRGAEAIARALRDAGITVLENEARRLVTATGARVWLAGLGCQLAHTPDRGKRRDWRGVDDLPATLAQVDDDAPVILLAHEPDIFATAPPRVTLTLSGHTHGGQVRLFGRAWVVPSRHGRRYAWGHIVEDGRHLVVSGGLGCSGIPLRLGVPPEITVIDLVDPARTAADPGGRPDAARGSQIA